MGVYIPNMSKPKNCRTCKFKSNKEGECWFVHYDIDCPLIEIIRCGECKWWNRDGKRKDGKGWCENAICGLTKPNAFCSYGERSADEK